MIRALASILLMLPVAAYAQGIEEETLPPPPPPEPRQETRPPVTSVPMEIAELRALDTITGIITDLEVPVGGELDYERLTIRVEACRGSGEGDTPDAFAFLTIADIRREEPYFTGWMIASSPALSAMDHPRYDVWVLRCRMDSASASGSSANQSD